MSDFLSTLREGMASIYIRAVVILAVSIGLAKLIDVLFTRVLLRVAARTQTELDNRIINMLRRPIFYTLLLVGLRLAILPIVANLPIEDQEQAGVYIFGAIGTLMVLIWVRALTRISKLFIEKVGDQANRWRFITPQYVPLFHNLSRVLIFVIGTMLVLSIWEIRITGFIASAGIAGFVIAFAAQDTLANFFGGLFIYIDRPYKIGDYITLDSGEKGVVAEIGLRSTRVRTKDDVEIIVPNAKIANAKITNESAPRGLTRVRAPIGVAYGSDIDRVREVLMEIAQKTDQVVDRPEPRVRFRSFGDSSLNFELLCWVKNPLLRGRVLDALNTQIYKRFHETDIKIPFPQRDLHIRDLPERGNGRIEL
ncbi:MAG: mechanosensitive ion channel family protein [Candidatus Bipolaricaulia bacterium]